MREQGISSHRISSAGQSEGHSLEAQNSSTTHMAESMNVEIVRSWSIVQSSNKGKNIKRKDLQEILAYCKGHRRVKYLFLDRVNRLMREMMAMVHYIVELEAMGVKVMFCDPTQQYLNGNDQLSRLMLIIEGFKAEQENKERAETTVSRMKSRYAAGYYLSHPHAGYMKSETPGIHIPDAVRFEILQKGSRLIVHKQYTVQQAVRWMNDNGYSTVGGKRLDVGHYIEFIVDRYYCGKIDIRSEGWPKDVDGLHEPMFSTREHKMLTAAINNRNPRLRRQHNPDFPLANLLRHAECEGLGGYEKFAGIWRNSGKRPSGKQRALKPVYDCRDCRKRISKERAHKAFSDYLGSLQLLPTEKAFKEALVRVWRRQRGSVTSRTNTLRLNKESLKRKVKVATASYIAETDESIKQNIRTLLSDYDARLKEIESDIFSATNVDIESEGFVRFALEHTAKIRDKWWSLSFEKMKGGEQILFNGKIYVDNFGKVRPLHLSSIYRLGTNKKALSKVDNAHLVELPVTATGSASLAS